MVAEARARGLELTGPNGLLKLFTKNVLETALNEELNGKRSAIDRARHVRHLKVGRSHDPGEAEFGKHGSALDVGEALGNPTIADSHDVDAADVSIGPAVAPQHHDPIT
jgi:hypothetical protein